MMNARWEYGDGVRLVRNVKNDGTYPGLPVGAPLVRRGTIGHVIDVGTFLQDQIIYSVHFLEEGRIVGCREEELIDIDEPWIESRFEVRQKLCAAGEISAKSTDGDTAETGALAHQGRSGAADRRDHPGRPVSVAHRGACGCRLACQAVHCLGHRVAMRFCG